MHWLTGIICIILVVRFWRIFVPLGAVAALGLVAILLFEKYQTEATQKKTEAEKLALQNKISFAQQHQSSENKEWNVYYENDPASNVAIARTASIVSNDGLCILSVQKRLNSADLTGLDCSGIPIQPYDGIEIKFDTDNFSRKMDLAKYTDSERVYIPSYQNNYSSNFGYNTFLEMMGHSGSLAIHIPGANEFWTRFSLRDASSAIAQLGKPKSAWRKARPDGSPREEDFSTFIDYIEARIDWRLAPLVKDGSINPELKKYPILPPPNEKDFGTYSEYIYARIDWKIYKVLGDYARSENKQNHKAAPAISEPTEANFDNFSDYIIARIDWKIDKAFAEGFSK